MCDTRLLSLLSCSAGVFFPRAASVRGATFVSTSDFAPLVLTKSSIRASFHGERGPAAHRSAPSAPDLHGIAMKLNFVAEPLPLDKLDSARREVENL